MAHISDLTPGPGERHAVFGGTRAGKSALMEWGMRTVQLERPNAMQILVDSKPRFRAEKERGPLRRGRRNAAYRYESWASGPTVPNSVVADIWDEHPFRNLWNEPGEIVIVQSGDAADWKRILTLLNGFTQAHIKGRERRMIVDECLDFIRGTLLASTLKTMSFTVLRVRELRGVLAWKLGRTVFMGCLHSSCICCQGSHCSICARTPI